MILAKFLYKEKQLTGCRISGHAEYAEAGQDIICAYVSAAVQTIANTMTEVFHFPILAQEQEEPAEIYISLEQAQDDPVAVKILSGLEFELNELAKAFPKNIRLIHMEV